jgi:sigma-B regulation protein RsbU (phosphoserine phosphatase)
MAAKLRIIGGKNSGISYQLVDAITTMGRSPGCHVVIPEEAASRQHAEIMHTPEGYLLVDLQSRNGTSINGFTIEGQTLLRDRDRISICSTTLEFQSGPTTSDLMMIEDPISGPDTVDSTVLSRIDAQQSAENLARFQPEAKLRAILELNEAIGQTIHIDDLLPKILDSLMKLFTEADRAILVLMDEQEKLYVHSIYHRDPNDHSIEFSRTVINTAIAEKQAILSADASTDARFATSETMVDVRTRSVMCAPLLATGGDGFGVIQIETQSFEKSLTEDDLQVLASLTAVSAMAIEKADMYEQSLQQKKVEQELSFAREVQQGFLPFALPHIDNFSTWAFYEPAGHVGGDFYDVVELPNGNFALMVADVSGKGVPAALMMARASSEAKVGLASSPGDLGHAMNYINIAMCAARLPGRFVTMVVCVLDPSNRRVTMATAGHMSPLVRRNSGNLEEPITEDNGGIPIGVSASWEFDVTSVTLQPGERIVLYTDGITEAMNEHGDMYSDERLAECVKNAEADLPTADLGKRIIDDVHIHVGNGVQNDDITLLVFGCDS